MITFNLSDAESYKAYCATLAKQNKLLGEDHFLFGDVDTAINSAKIWKGKKLWAWPSERGRMQDRNSDNYFLVRDGSMWVAGPAASAKHSDEELCYQQCEKIMKQILSKMIYDRHMDVLSTSFSSYVISRQEMTLSGTKFIGCELTFSWDDPTDLEYNEEDWILI